MHAPHSTVEELLISLARYDREAVPGCFHTGRYNLRFVTWGTASPALRPVILVHGLCDTNRSFAMLMARLVDDGFHVVGYELANGKDDDAVLGSYRHEDFADDLVALADHMGFEQVDVMGSSFGSTITLRTLIRHPGRFRRAILQGGFPRRPLLRIERGLSRLGRYWPWRMGELPIRETAMTKIEGHQFVGCPPEIFRFLLDCSGQTPIRAAARRALMIDKLDLRRHLPAIRTPVLMIGGDRDVLVPRELEAEIEAGLPDVRRIEFSPCGHYPQYTMAGRMAREMASFLKQ